MKIILSAILGTFLMLVVQAVSNCDGRAVSENKVPIAEATPVMKSESETTKKPVKLTLSMNDTACVKSAQCVVKIELQNLSGQDIAIECGFGLILGHYRSDSYKEMYLDSPLDLNTLENLQPNQHSRCVLAGNQIIEKEIDLTKIKWLKAIQSSWHYYDLWDNIGDGKFTLSAEIKEYSKDIDPKRIKKDVAATKTVGNKDVAIVNIEPVLSLTTNSLDIDFKEK